jgi:hypothetical protein
MKKGRNNLIVPPFFTWKLNRLSAYNFVQEANANTSVTQSTLIGP